MRGRRVARRRSNQVTVVDERVQYSQEEVQSRNGS
jgi:hypothetical protein